MTKRFSGILQVCLAGLGIFALAGLSCRAGEAAGSTGMVRHFVAFKYKDDTTPADIAAIDAALLALKHRIPQIVSIERGMNNSPEKRNLGFTDGFLLTFRTTADRDVYLTHPAHLAFVKTAMPKIADAFVFDFTVE